MPSHVTQDVFLTELTKMYSANRAKGTVSVTFKRGAWLLFGFRRLHRAIICASHPSTLT